MTRPLSVKQRRLIKGVVEGKTKKQAALEAGYNPKRLNETAYETLKKPNVREALLEAMKKAKIDEESISKVVKEAMEANKTISAVTGKDANGGTVDFVDVPDHPTRLKAADMAVDILGAKAPKKLDVRDQTLEDLIGILDDGGSETTEDAEGTS